MATQIQLRRDTAANWTSTNPTLAQGEPGLETDTGKIKYGDGSTAWTSLAYAESNQEFATGSPSSPSLTFTGRPGTGIYSPGADQVAISTNGTGRLFVDASGNVSIGSALDQALNVQRAGANAYARFTDNTVNAYVGVNNANALFDAAYVASNHPIRFITNNTEKLRITSAGLVGIGTSAPSTTLDVNGTLTCGTAGGVSIAIANGSAIRNSSATANAIYFDTSFGSATHGSFEFRSSNAGTTRMLIDSSGRVGIGTTSPGGELHVAGSDANTDIFITEGSTSTDARIRNSNGVLLLDADVNNENAGSAFVVGVDGTERARIDALGRLLVGTSTSNGGGAGIECTSINSTSSALLINQTNATAGTTYKLITGYKGVFGVSAVETFIVYNNGNVQNTNNSYTIISDAKLKENIVNANSQWDDIKAVKIRNWNFKPETGYETHRQIGPVAQEIEQVCPRLVFETPDRDAKGNDLGTVTKGVNTSVLYMKAIKALQEAMERIEQLETEMAAVKAQLS